MAQPLERIALHQTRLRTPGLALDPSGVALGARGLVLLPTIERLVAFLSIYTRDRSFADLLGERDVAAEGGLDVSVVRSPLKTREIVVSFPASSTTLVDVVADVARLAGGLTFTGTSRYYVQYRDKTAPFGYDVVDLLRVEEGTDFALHHLTFTQAYARERAINLNDLVARLEPRPDPTITVLGARPLWITAEQGIAPALIAYLARSGVDAEVGIVELPAESSFDDGPRRIGIIRVNELPPRLERLVTRTPGVKGFVPAGPGVAVQVGHRHPIHLMGLPVFPPQGLALLPAPAPGREPLIIDALPQMAAVSALVGVKLEGKVVKGSAQRTPGGISVPLQLAPSVSGARQVTASLVPVDRAPLLRRLAYALPTASLEAATIARISAGGLGELIAIRIPGGVDAIPLGSFFSERAPGLYVLSGHDLVPQCAPSHLARAIGASGTSIVFVFREPGDPPATVRAFAVDAHVFVPLSTALVEPESWGALMPVEVVELARTELEEPLGTIAMGALGMAPMRGV